MLVSRQVRREPRRPEPLLAGGIELRKLGDGGDLAEQPPCIKMPLLDRGCRPRQLGRPAHLILDLLDELADLFSGALRLLALDSDQRIRVFAVGIDDLEKTIAEQGDANDRKKQADIFPEQRPADLAPTGLFGDRREDGRLAIAHCRCSSRRHSITSSALAIRFGATSSPIASGSKLNARRGASNTRALPLGTAIRSPCRRWPTAFPGW